MTTVEHPNATVLDRGFYVMFRLYSPSERLFDGTWALPDIEPA
jgi:hypothetical protein